MKTNKTTLILSAIAVLVIVVAGYATWKSSSTYPQADDVSSATTTSQSISLTKEEVRDLQRNLNSETNANLTVDGILGQKTYDAVKKFQFEQNVAVTGDLDSETLSLLGIAPTEVYREPASVPTTEESERTTEPWAPTQKDTRMDRSPGMKKFQDRDTQMQE